MLVLLVLSKFFASFPLNDRARSNWILCGTGYIDLMISSKQFTTLVPLPFSNTSAVRRFEKRSIRAKKFTYSFFSFCIRPPISTCLFLLGSEIFLFFVRFLL